MTTQLTKNRKFINGTSDSQGIGKRVLESPVVVDGDQFVVGSKSFVAPTRFYSDVSSGGFYYGDGSKLVNLPIVNDPSKLPLSGGTMSGPINWEPVNDKDCVISQDAISFVDVAVPSEMRLDIYGCQKTGSGNDFIIRNEEPLGIGAQKQFVRLECGQSYKSSPSKNLVTGEHFIERDEHVKVFDDKLLWDPNTAFRFRSAFDYLDQNAKGGFSVLLSNCSPNPARVEPNEDGTLFYCKDIGGEVSEFYIHEWDTTRVTLVILSDGSYRWAVTMYR